jgi:N-sulfoglucosamine sulfohydrolase
MRILPLLFPCLAFATAVLTYADETAPVHRPNIILIESDDQRQDAVGSFGNDVIKTPALDRLARRRLRGQPLHAHVRPVALALRR